VGGQGGEVFQGLVGIGCHERSLLWLLIVLDSVVVTNSSVGCWINDPTGYLWRTRSFENKHEEEGGVNWKLLPAGIWNQWVGFAAGRSGAYICLGFSTR
jgi:hypothetical protein